MKTIHVALILCGLAILGTSHATAEPLPVGDRAFGTFYTSLAPYGDWIEVDGLTVWRPMRIRAGWRPYMEGRWIWTDYGWYWSSVEPFGWATYHYGRWYYDEWYGWVWVPDHTWGPAWVEWRYNDDYVGWAPLPPYATFSVTIGIRFTTHWSAPHHYWCFVRHHAFGRTIRYRDLADEYRSRRLIGSTRNGGGYEVDRDRVVNRGVSREFIERQGGLRIDRMDVRDAPSGRRESIIRDHSSGSERIEAYRPTREQIESGRSNVTIRQEGRRLSWESDHIERPTTSRSDGMERRTNRETFRPSDENSERPAITRPVEPSQERRESAPANRQENRRIESPERRTTPESGDRLPSITVPDNRRGALRTTPPRAAQPRQVPERRVYERPAPPTRSPSPVQSEPRSETKRSRERRER